MHKKEAQKKMHVQKENKQDKNEKACVYKALFDSFHALWLVGCWCCFALAVPASSFLTVQLPPKRLA